MLFVVISLDCNCCRRTHRVLEHLLQSPWRPPFRTKCVVMKGKLGSLSLFPSFKVNKFTLNMLLKFQNYVCKLRWCGQPTSLESNREMYLKLPVYHNTNRVKYYLGARCIVNTCDRIKILLLMFYVVSLNIFPGTFWANTWSLLSERLALARFQIRYSETSRSSNLELVVHSRWKPQSSSLLQESRRRGRKAI